MQVVRIRNFVDRRYIKSLVAGVFREREFKSIQTFLFFIGYQRSGHSFIGSLIDAHPNASIGMEVDALNLVKLGYNRSQIFYCLVRNSEIFHKILKNEWTGYSYAVDGQYQGRYKKLLVVGDKKGGKSTLRLGEDISLYSSLVDLVSCDVRILHVVRHPLDNISTMVLRNIQEPQHNIRKEIRKRIEIYFHKADINRTLLQHPGMTIKTIYHEEFIINPSYELASILDFIGLKKEDNYMNSCVRMVYTQPHKSRENLDWPEDLLNEVLERMTYYKFLRKYLENEEK